MLALLLALAGLTLVIAFCVVVWWPSALLVGGIALLAAAVGVDLYHPGDAP